MDKEPTRTFKDAFRGDIGFYVGLLTVNVLISIVLGVLSFIVYKVLA